MIIHYKTLYTLLLFLCVCFILCSVTYFSNFILFSVSCRPCLKGRRDTLPLWFIFVHCKCNTTTEQDVALICLTQIWFGYINCLYCNAQLFCQMLLTNKMFECTQQQIAMGNIQQLSYSPPVQTEDQYNKSGTSGYNLKLLFLNFKYQCSS